MGMRLAMFGGSVAFGVLLLSIAAWFVIAACSGEGVACGHAVRSLMVGAGVGVIVSGISTVMLRRSLLSPTSGNTRIMAALMGGMALKFGAAAALVLVMFLSRAGGGDSILLPAVTLSAFGGSVFLAYVAQLSSLRPAGARDLTDAPAVASA